MTADRADRLVARGVSRRHGRGDAAVLAVATVDLRLRAGELVALAGASGSGKSTLLGILGGWVRADTGEVTVDGRQVAVDDPLGWSAVAVVPQQLGLLGELTVRENVDLARGRAVTSHEVDALLGALGVDQVADRWPAEISLGEQQRTAVARALVARPSVLLVDEPTAHLDEAAAALVAARLVDAVRAGTACLVATHDPRLLTVADRVLPMRDGVVGASPSPPGNLVQPGG